MYHTDENVLLGAPTSSGKTCVAEMAIFRLLRVYPDKKVRPIYLRAVLSQIDPKLMNLYYTCKSALRRFPHLVGPIFNFR